MIVEQRTYRVRAGTVRDYLHTYEHEGGLALQRQHLGRMVGYFHTEFGPLNEIVHLWAYDDLNQRDKCRAAMQADPEWAVYLAKNRPFMISQDTRLMKVAPFFVERLKKMLAATK